jgi:hypothetical protein
VGGARVTYPALLSELPDGVFIAHDDEFWLVSDGGLHRWTPAGYADRIDQFDGPAAVLTPRATVAAIRAGYRPLVHWPALLRDPPGRRVETLQAADRLLEVVPGRLRQLRADLGHVIDADLG